MPNENNFIRLKKILKEYLINHALFNSRIDLNEDIPTFLRT